MIESDISTLRRHCLSSLETECSEVWKRSITECIWRTPMLTPQTALPPAPSGRDTQAHLLTNMYSFPFQGFHSENIFSHLRNAYICNLENIFAPVTLAVAYGNLYVYFFSQNQSSSPSAPYLIFKLPELLLNQFHHSFSSPMGEGR